MPDYLTSGSPPLDGVSVALMFLGYLLLGIIPASLAVYLVYFLLTLPMRRNERARLLLDGLELGLQQGKPPERALVDLAECQDHSFGARFYLLAEELKKGVRLSEALGRVPRLLPPRVVAMLQTGERIGNVPRVLPACRQVLADGVSQVRGALNYVLLIVFVLSPGMVFIPAILSLKVLPAYRMVFSESTGANLPGITAFLYGQHGWLTFFQSATILFLWLTMIIYLGGPRLGRWVDGIWPGLTDHLVLRFPWKRKRLQRDFSSMLALLLDAGLPEPQALAQAAEATGNRTWIRRAHEASGALSKGLRLPEAIAQVDHSGELRWRIQNAAHGPAGFLRALRGWHESLDAKAFQLEQAAAQVTTTALVLLNGVIVAAIVIGIFQALISIINSANLW